MILLRYQINLYKTYNLHSHGLLLFLHHFFDRNVHVDRFAYNLLVQVQDIPRFVLEVAGSIVRLGDELARLFTTI